MSYIYIYTRAHEIGSTSLKQVIDFETSQVETRVAAMHGVTFGQVVKYFTMFVLLLKHVETSLLTRARPQLASLVTDALVLTVTVLYRMTQHDCNVAHLINILNQEC